MRLLAIFLLLVVTQSLRQLVPLSQHSRRGTQISRQQIQSMKDEDIPIEIVIRTTKSFTTSNKITDSKENIVALDSLYEDSNERTVEKVLDSPVTKVLGVVFNPTYLLLSLYCVGWGMSKVFSLQKTIFSSLLRNRNDVTATEKTETVAETPFQVFQCETCGMEMRPAKGRAEKIFAKPRFRCSRCGSKADAFFNIDDMNDPRAVERLERLKAEEEDQFNFDDE